MYEAGLMEDLEHLPPGPELATLLSTLDYSTLDPAQRVEALCAEARQAAHYQARMLTAMVAAAESVEKPEYAADEISFALHWTRQGAEGQVYFAQELVGRLSAVHTALLAGVIDVPRARVIAELAGPLDDQSARLVVEKVLPAAPGLTTGQLRAKLRRLVISADPEAAKKRQEKAVRERRVECYPDPDGTVTLLSTGLPAERAKAAADRIDQLARAARQAGDDRNLDQLRADLMLDVLDGSYSGHDVDARVEVTVPLETLLCLSDAPGELAGYGPLLADVARQVAENSGQHYWKYTVIGPQGRPVQHGTTRRPSAELARKVRARDRTCRAPGCRMPAIRCDIDHRRDWQHGGESTKDNLCCLCRHHHRMKHELGWRYRQIAPGVWAWTSPTTGRTYTVPPDDIP